jgi:hypothetical protein
MARKYQNERLDIQRLMNKLRLRFTSFVMSSSLYFHFICFDVLGKRKIILYVSIIKFHIVELCACCIEIFKFPPRFTAFAAAKLLLPNGCTNGKRLKD